MQKQRKRISPALPSLARNMISLCCLVVYHGKVSKSIACCNHNKNIVILQKLCMSAFEIFRHIFMVFSTS